MEMLVVVGGVAMLAFLGVPAVRTLLRSFEGESSARSMISSALASARAVAAREQRYAGVRFQKAYDPRGPLEADQYMIFIVHDYDRTGLASGFCAVEGIKPIKLSGSLGVMDLRLGGTVIEFDDDFYDPADGWPPRVRDTTAFSVVFSPSGKLVLHNVHVWNRDGRRDDLSNDDVFNTIDNVEAGTGMFYQDDYPDEGLDEEPSRTNFVIYERARFREALGKEVPLTGYLENLVPIYINPYTGTMISTD
jgi:hypothetical protein